MRISWKGLRIVLMSLHLFPSTFAEQNSCSNIWTLGNPWPANSSYVSTCHFQKLVFEKLQNNWKYSAAQTRTQKNCLFFFSKYSSKQKYKCLFLYTANTAMRFVSLKNSWIHWYILLYCVYTYINGCIPSFFKWVCFVYN